ncbi:MAG: SDR family NAD(P)-dependent oxidoreductase [Candidatus Dormibacteria bacterium]
MVLTGAAGALGTLIAEALNQRGATLVLADRDSERLLPLAERLGGTAVPSDIATDEGRRALLAQAGEVDILINAAGVERAAWFEQMSSDDIRRAVDVNLTAAMLLTREVLAGMRARGHGQVISIASVAGTKPIPFNALYSTTKAGLTYFSLCLSKELEGSGIAATVICPAAVREVGMWARGWPHVPHPWLLARTTIGPDEVVRAVLRAVAKRPRRIMVASPTVRFGAVLAALSPSLDSALDRVSGLRRLYRHRIDSDRNNRL